MKTTMKRWIGPIAGALVATVVVGAVAYAAIPTGNVYTACMLKNVGTIRLIDPTLPSGNPRSHCTSLETQVAWNQKGDPGPAGKDGADGLDGQPGAAGAKGDPGLRFRGPWNQFFDYAVGDVVQHGGSSWVATESACCGDKPGDAAEWSLLAAAGVTGYEVRFSDDNPVNPGTTTVRTLTCPSGKRVLTGGYDTSGPSLHVLASAPSGSGDGWAVSVSNEAPTSSTTAGGFNLFVICANV
jgi:hypothetical protein